MLSFFRVNDPYRLVVIFILLILIRIPYLLSSEFLSIPELLHLTVGEALSGNKTLYEDFWAAYAPFSAFFYWLLYELFGKSQLAHQVVAVFLVVIQASIFNSILLKNKAFNENSYLPAFVYVILSNLFFDLSSLSPSLMGLTFIVLSYGYIFQRFDKKTGDSFFLNTGMLLGIATLFHFSSVVFLLSTLVSLILFSASILRRYFLLIIGYLIPIILVAIYYNFYSAGYEFWRYFIVSFLFLKKEYFFSTDAWPLTVIPLAFLFFSLYAVGFKGKYVNHQVRYLYAMFFGLIAGALSVSLSVKLVPGLLIILVPFVSFFICHFFFLKRKLIWNELLFLSLVLLILTTNYGSAFFPSAFFSEKSKSVLVSSNPTGIEDKGILNLSNNYNYYLQNRAVTRYFNPQLSKQHFSNLDYFDNISEIYLEITEKKPEIVIDNNDQFKNFLDKAPLVKEKYRETSKGIYELKN